MPGQWISIILKTCLNPFLEVVHTHQGPMITKTHPTSQASEPLHDPWRSVEWGFNELQEGYNKRPLPYERVPGFLLLPVGKGCLGGSFQRCVQTTLDFHKYIYTVLYTYIFQQSGKNTNLLKPKATLWIIDLQALKQSKHFYPGSPS